MPGHQKACVLETENLELATFSKQAQNEGVLSKFGEVWIKFQFFMNFGS